ncbi:MAG: 7-cyano-7-deazaguanine synthase [Planctomycetes bacterium]|nr:7-cyano-7-deazaguanine synthase [Planctomycetota bacterium]
MSTALLLSGGIDSIALGYWVRPEYAISVDYGQLAADAEIAASQQVCLMLNIQHEVIRANCAEAGFGNMLARTEPSAGTTFEGPSPEWWPYRNQLLITLAAGRCIALGCKSLLIGTVASDARHRDGNAEFVNKMNELLSCQEGGISVVAPGIDLTSLLLVREAKVPLSVLGWAHSCHCANVPCGSCRGCQKYREVFNQLLESESEPVPEPTTGVAKEWGRQ